MSQREFADTTLAIVGFATTRSGDLLVVDHGNGFYRFVPQPRVRQTLPFPTRLSETGLFASTETHEMRPGVIGYLVIALGLERRRLGPSGGWRCPGEEQVGFNQSRPWTFPNGTALVQTLSVEQEDHRGLAKRFRVETRVLLRQQNEWVGYSYRWNEAQTNAELIPRDGAKATFRVADAKSPGGFRRQNWVFPKSGGLYGLS